MPPPCIAGVAGAVVTPLGTIVLNNCNQIYIINLLIGFILGPDRNSGSVPVKFGLIPVPVGYR